MMSIRKSVEPPPPATTVSSRLPLSVSVTPLARIWPAADQLIVDESTVVVPPGLMVRKPAPHLADDRDVGGDRRGAGRHEVGRGDRTGRRVALVGHRDRAVL